MFENGSGIRFEGCALRQRYPRQTISTTPIDSWLTNRSTKLFLPLIASLALWGVPVALADDGSHARHVAIALKAGETYPLAGVDRSQGFQVRFEQNPHCFAVDCAIGGQCYILATEQGSGSVQAAATGGGNT